MNTAAEAPQVETTRAIEAAVQTYADALGIPVKKLPLDQHIAVMAACVEAVRVVFREIEEEG